MSMGRSAAKAALVVATAAALLGVSPAFAEYYDSYSDGAHAYSHSSSHPNVAVSDTKGDSHGVYANYNRKYSGSHRLNNNGGHGSTVYGPLDYTDYVTGLQACTEISLWPDDCGSWDKAGDGR